MGKRADAKRLNALTERIARIVFDRLTSDESRAVLAFADSEGLSRAEALASFYRTQYPIVCREMMEFASRHRSENLFKANESRLYDQAFRIAAGSVYGDGTADAAVRLALTPPEA